MKVAVMGYGTVGSGVVEVIETHEKSIKNRTAGEMLEVSHILDLRDFPDDPHADLFTKDFNDILNDPETKVVAETMGGVNPAAKQATVAPPVYANKFKTLTSLCSSLETFEILFIIQSQFTACSGNTPVCLNPIGFMLKVKFLYLICQLSGSFLLYSQYPPPVELLLYFAFTFFHFSGNCFSFHIICGSGLTNIIFFHLSSFSPFAMSSIS